MHTHLDVEGAPRGATGANHVLVGDREQVALLHAQFAGLGDAPLHQLLHDGAHVLIPVEMMLRDDAGSTRWG